MSNIQAAIGCAQLERIDCLIKRKKEIFSFYKDAFADLTEINLNHELANCSIGAWMPTVVCSRKSGVKRERLLEEFLKEGIDARVFFWPLSSLPPFLNHPKLKMHMTLLQEQLICPAFMI